MADQSGTTDRGLRAGLAAAAATGAFCTVFTLLVSAVVDALPLLVALSLSFVSGFCGSLFARFLLKGADK